jgi:hypothetical protein
MDALPAAKPDLRPSRSQIEALLAGISMNHVIRRAVLEAFEEHGLLSFTKVDPQITVDELGRLRRTRVNEALNGFDEVVRSGIIAILEKLHSVV